MAKKLTKLEKAIKMTILSLNHTIKNADNYSTLDLIEKRRDIESLGLDVTGAPNELDYAMRLELSGRISILEDIIMERIY